MASPARPAVSLLLEEPNQDVPADSLFSPSCEGVERVGHDQSVFGAVSRGFKRAVAATFILDTL